ncbi:hypothetical protein D9M68_847010 [compost metagenome]
MPRLARAEQGFQFLHVAGEIIGTAQAIAAQGPRGEVVGTGGAPQAQFDAARIEAGEGAELLGDHQRRVVGQHDPARTQADAGGAASQVGQQHGSGRAGDAFHVVVLGHPETREAQALDVARQLQGIVQGLGGATVVADGREIEDGKGQVGQGRHGQDLGRGQVRDLIRVNQ